MDRYLKENDKAYNDFLDITFFNDWENYRANFKELKWSSLELIVSPECNLACKYCYVNKYAKETYPVDIYDADASITNLKKILHWLDKNSLSPEIDIFSGELFAQKIGYEVIDTIYDFYKDIPEERRIPSIIIPTNFTFLCSEEYTKIIEDYIQRFESIGIRFHLSASFDGKYMEQNRPFKHQLDIEFDMKRDDEYYDKVFDFIRRHRSGLHPMVYSSDIDKWEQNFLWFQDMMAKHNIHWKSIYLLQVRNQEWTEEQSYELYKFIRFLFNFAWEKLDKNPDLLYDFLVKPPLGFNLLHEGLGENSTGLSCALQNEFSIRLSDMKQFPCHRLMYEGLEIGHFVDDEESVLKFETKNASLGMITHATNKRNFPVCATCNINNLCIGGCLGSQFETNGDMFLPIPTVCKNQHFIIKAIIDELVDKGIYWRVYDDLSLIAKEQLEFVRKGARL